MSEILPYKIVTFGDRGVGKRTFLNKGTSKFFENDPKINIGVDFYIKYLEVEGIRIKLQIWSLIDEERFRLSLPNYVRGSNGALFMYDVTSYSSLAHIDDWLMLIKKELRAEDRCPILVIGNKADLLDEREVTGDEGIEFARSKGVDGFIECSSKTGENIQETFEALASLMIHKRNSLK